MRLRQPREGEPKHRSRVGDLHSVASLKIKKEMPMRQHVCFRLPVTLLFLLSLAWVPVRADEVTDWNAITARSIKTGGTSAVATGRVMAIVHAAIYDAVNGVERRFEPLHVDFDAPRGASQRAAAVQAAYAALVKLYPSQAGAVGADRDASLTPIH